MPSPVDDLIERGIAAAKHESFQEGYQKGLRDGKEVTALERRSAALFLAYLRDQPNKSIRIDRRMSISTQRDAKIVDLGLCEDGVHQVFQLIEA